MQIPSHRMFIQTHNGVWAITMAYVAKQYLCHLFFFLPFPLLFFSIVARTVAGGGSSVHKFVGHCESPFSREGNLAIDLAT